VQYEDSEIEMYRGVPQGAPISPTLFCLFMEYMINPLKQIDGLNISAYADDLFIYSSS